MIPPEGRHSGNLVTSGTCWAFPSRHALVLGRGVNDDALPCPAPWYVCWRRLKFLTPLKILLYTPRHTQSGNLYLRRSMGQRCAPPCRHVCLIYYTEVGVAGCAVVQATSQAMPTMSWYAVHTSASSPSNVGSCMVVAAAPGPKGGCLTGAEPSAGPITIHPCESAALLCISAHSGNF